jgi:signal transduction histidine kinase
MDEATTDAPHDEDEERRRIHRAKNAKRAKCRRNAQARAQNPPLHRNLNGTFAATEDHEYATPIGNIAEAAILLQQLPQNLETTRAIELAQRAIIRLDQ